VSVEVAVPDLPDSYFPAFASAVVDVATQRGWNVVVDDFRPDSGRDARDSPAPQLDALIR
jgi:hypothetical protein